MVKGALLYMSFLTGILSTVLTISSANNISVETPQIEDISLSQALLCSNHEMTVPMGESQESFLRSFNDAEVHVTGNGSFFNGDMLARDLFTYREIENPDAPGYVVSFDAAYIAGLDICIIDITLVKDGIDFMKETALVLPFEDNLGNKDSEIVMNGFKYYRSELLQGSVIRPNSYFSPQDAHEYSGIFLEFEGWLPALSHDINEPRPLENPCGSGIVFAVIGIADAISGVDSVVGFAHRYLDIPLLSITALSDWLFFEAKMSQMKNNFAHNVNAEMPIQKNNSFGRADRHGKHYIFNQADYSDWKFSFFGNLSDQGCGVAAAYNMLIDCNNGDYIDLPTLIALFEALNADALFGCFGVNMVPDGYVSSLASYLNTAALEVAYNCTASVMAVFRVMAGSARNVFEAMAWSVLGTIVTANTAVAAIAIVDMVFASTLVLVHFFNHYKHDVAFVIERYIGSNYTHRSMNYDDFSEQISFGNQAIVCFWNEIANESLGLINYLLGAHFVYINKSQTDGSYYCYNYDRSGYLFSTTAIHATVGATSDSEAAIKTISSYCFYI